MQPLFVTHFFNHAVTARRLFWLVGCWQKFSTLFFIYCHLYNHHECSCYFCSLHLCQDVLLVGFFFFFTHICVVLCCCPLSGVCVYMDLDIFFHFCLVFFWLWKNQREKVSFFGVFYGWFFLFWILFLHYVTLLLLVMNV